MAREQSTAAWAEISKSHAHTAYTCTRRRQQIDYSIGHDSLISRTPNHRSSGQGRSGRPWRRLDGTEPSGRSTWRDRSNAPAHPLFINQRCIRHTMLPPPSFCHGRRPYQRPGRILCLLAALLLSVTALGIAPPLTPADTRTVEGWMRRMTLEDKVAQMNHIPISQILVDPETVRVGHGIALWMHIC
jgi:hypothetical protein